MADGETLWSIARRYEVTVDAVREANEIAESETIRPGQTLRIPRAASGSSSVTASSTRTESGSSRSGTAASRASGEGSSSAARPSSSSTSGSRTGSAARAREHTVGEGETLWGIARRYETTVESLRRANDLEEDEQIQPGQKLSIPQN